MVGSCQRIRTTTARNSAEFAWRLPPRLSRWRLVLPDDAGIGQTPHSLAKAASERIRLLLSPAATSNSAAISGPIPNAATSWGAAAVVRALRWREWLLISS